MSEWQEPFRTLAVALPTYGFELTAYSLELRA